MSPRTRRDFLRGSLAAAVAVGAGGTLLAACGDDDEPSSQAGGGSTDTTAARELVKLTAMMPFQLGLNFITDVAGRSCGFFPDSGLDLDLQFAQGAPQALQQLAAGNVTVIRNAPLALVRAVSQEGAPFVSIAMANQKVLYVLISTESRPFDDAAALEGRKVGMATLGGNAEDTLNLVLKGAGIDPASVERVAVGNEAAGLTFVEDGRVDVLFGTTESAASMEAAGLSPHIAELEGANPLLGTNIVTTVEKAEQERDALVRYLRGLHEVMLAVRDEDRLREMLPQIRADWELPQLDEPDAAIPVINAISSLWFAEGEENLLRNVPERWEEGVAGFARLNIAKPDADPTSFYTNDLLDEALA